MGRGAPSRTLQQETVVAMALSARASGDDVRFYVAQDGSDVNFTRMIVGELF